MSDHENLMAGTAVLSILALGLNDFAIRLIKRGRYELLTDAVLQEVRHACITEWKNTDTSGMGIDQEAALLGQAFDQLEQFLDRAISQGRQ